MSRSVEISWSMKSENPFLTITLGPTTLNDVLFSNRSKIVTQPFSNFDYNNVDINLETEGVKIGSSINIERIISSGFLSNNFSELSEFSFDFFTFSYNGFVSFLASKSSGVLNQVDLKNNKKNPTVSLSFSTDQVQGQNPSLTASDLFGVIEFHQGDVNFNLGISNTNLDYQNASIDHIKFSGEYSLISNILRAKAVTENIALASGTTKIPKLDAKFRRLSEDEYDTKIMGDIDSFDLIISGQYLGRIPSGNFILNTVINPSSARIQANSFIKLETSATDRLEANHTLSIDFLTDNKLQDCVDLSCKLSELNSDFKINLDDDWIRGNSSCSSYPCSLGLVSHQFETSNTQEIFKKISQEKLLSPFVMAYLFSMVNNAEKSKEGHLVTVN